MSWSTQLGLLVALFSILGCAGLLASFLWKVPPMSETQYAAMIDCGSSGSRIFVYKWAKRYTSSLPVISAVVGSDGSPLVLKITPGISSFTSNTSQAGPSLKPLIDYAISKLAQQRVNTTYLFLEATAGMRLLDNTTAAAIMDNVRAYLKATPFLFEEAWARIIPGQEEAVNSWMAANNLAGLLDPPAHPNATWGSVEVGGASAQVAFVPDPDVVLPLENQWNITVGDTKYNIYVNSYLGFGATETRYDINTTIALNGSRGVPENGSVIQNPCFNKNYTETVYTSFNGTPVLYYLVGSGEYYNCSFAMPTLFTLNASCPVPNCTFNGYFQPPLRGLFRGFDNIIKMQTFFNLTTNFTLHQLAEKANDFCTWNWTYVQHSFPRIAPTDLPYACFRAAYIPRFLTSLGFPFSESGMLEAQMYIAGTEVSYAVGAVALFVNNLGWDSKRIWMYKRYWFALPVSLTSLALAGVVVAIIIYLERRERQGYQKLN